MKISRSGEGAKNIFLTDYLKTVFNAKQPAVLNS